MSEKGLGDRYVHQFYQQKKEPHTQTHIQSEQEKNDSKYLIKYSSFLLQRGINYASLYSEACDNAMALELSFREIMLT